MVNSDILYAELLSNIRQISVVASLNSPASTQTILNLSGDAQSVALKHDGCIQRLVLPARVAASALLPTNAGSKEISWRLRLLDQTLPQKDVDFSQATVAPWAATDLPASAALLCKRCRAPFSMSGAVMIWKDLPSENWAEMMDFWHCHKPSDHCDKAGHRHEDEASDQKGYGAHTKLTAEPGIGFVGLTYFLLSEKDLQNIEKFSADSADQPQTLRCQECSTSVGTTDTQAEGIRLHKWRLSIPTLPTYPFSNFITSQIASLISSQAVSKFILHSPSKSKSILAIHAWILTPIFYYSLSSATGPKGPQLGMKLFYKFVRSTAAKEKLMDDAAVEEISLSDDVLGDLVGQLERSTGELPASVRKFQDWHVGLLDRYDVATKYAASIVDGVAAMEI